MNEFFFDEFISEVGRHLNEYFPGVSTRSSIIGYAILRFLNCVYVPEKVSFEQQKIGTYEQLILNLRMPYRLEQKKFQDYLTLIIQNLPIRLRENPGKEFTFTLQIPPQFVKTHKDQIILQLNNILSKNYKFFKYSTQHIEKHSLQLTMVLLNNHIENILIYSCPGSSKNEIWSKIVTIASKSQNPLNIVCWDVSNDIKNWPNIQFYHKNEQDELSGIDLSREKIIAVIEDYLLNIKDQLDVDEEFILPIDIYQCIDSFLSKQRVSIKENRYFINLIHHTKYVTSKILQEHEIKYYTLSPTGNQHLYYVFDSNNYKKFGLALKETNGLSCFDERLHQLKYYIKFNDWYKFEKTILFLINMNEVNYTDLILELFNYAKKYSLYRLIINLENLLTPLKENKKAASVLVGLYQFKLKSPFYYFKDKELEKEFNQPLKNQLFVAAFYSKNSNLTKELINEFCDIKSGLICKSDIIKETPQAILELVEKINKLSSQLKEQNNPSPPTLSGRSTLFHQNAIQSSTSSQPNIQLFKNF